MNLEAPWRTAFSFDGIEPVGLNTALGSLRKRYTQPTTHAMQHDQLLPLVPASVGNPTDPGVLLDSFLRCLGPIDRAVLMLALDDLSYLEIAQITGINSNTVGIRLNRIKQRFNRDYVEDHP